MSPTDLAPQEQQAAGRRHRVVNDFSIQVATVNGSGSQTANLVLLRSMLLMGVGMARTEHRGDAGHAAVERARCGKNWSDA